MFVTTSQPVRERRDLCLIRTARGGLAGNAEFLDDPENRARVGEYMADLARPYGLEVTESLTGQSYGELAAPLIAAAVSADEPVDLLVLAFSVHDLRPGRQTATYLSSVTPGAPLAFAICDQGSAAPFTGLRIATGYLSSAAITRALIIVVEQASLPYKSTAPLPAEHRAVAMLYGGAATNPQARVTGLRQHPGTAPEAVPALAAAAIADLAAGREARIILSAALAETWPAHGQARVMPPGQPATDIWWALIDELASDPFRSDPSRSDPSRSDATRSDATRPALLVAADYDPDLHYLSVTAFDPDPPGHRWHATATAERLPAPSL